MFSMMGLILLKTVKWLGVNDTNTNTDIKGATIQKPKFDELNAIFDDDNYNEDNLQAFAELIDKDNKDDENYSCVNDEAIPGVILQSGCVVKKSQLYKDADYT